MTVIPSGPKAIHRDPIHVFNGLAETEIRSAIMHLFSLIVQRGCLQRCWGCHATSYKTPTNAPWEQTQLVIDGTASAMKKFDIKPYRPLMEVFRDNDPSWIRFPDRPEFGVGNLAQQIHDKWSLPSKIMTSGAPIDQIDFVLDQYRIGAPHFFSTSLSVSIQTGNYLRDPDADVTVRGKIIDNFIRHNPSQVPAYLDVMFYTPEGKDERTQETIRLFRKIMRASNLFPRELADFDFSRIDGSRNQKFMDSSGRVGIRTSPFVSIASWRGIVTDGQKLTAVEVSDWLSIFEGKEDITYKVGDEYYTRTELKTNLHRRSLFIEGLRGLAMTNAMEAMRRTMEEASSALMEVGTTLQQDGEQAIPGAKERMERTSSLLITGQQDAIVNNWLVGNITVPRLDEIFCTEFDLTPPVRSNSWKIGLLNSGLRLGPTINFIVSNIAGGELQEIIPWVKFNFGE